MKPGDLVRVIPTLFCDFHELFGDENSPTRYLEEERLDTLIPTPHLVHKDELCTVLKVGKPDMKHHWIRVLKNNGETGWITSRWLEGVNENR